MEKSVYMGMKSACILEDHAYKHPHASREKCMHMEVTMW